MWCKTRAAHRTLLLLPRAWAHAWGKHRVIFAKGKRRPGRPGARALAMIRAPFFSLGDFYHGPPEAEA